MSKNNRLTPRQRRAIAALISSRNLKQAAQLAQVPERTLYTWMTLSHFRQALSNQEGEILNAVSRRLVALQDEAIDVLAGLIQSPKRPELKLQAARTVLDHLLKLRELHTLETRLTELERRVFGDLLSTR